MPNQTRIAEPHREYRIGPWTVSPRRCEIRRPGQVHRLQPKVMELLVYLAQRPGRVVTKDQLLEDLWPELYVTEYVVWRCIAQLRRTLGDDPKAPAFIETRHRVGYRLVAPVEELLPESRVLPVRRPVFALATSVLLLLGLATTWTVVVSDSRKLEAVTPETASELLRQGIEHYERHNWSDNAKAIQLLERAVDLEPESAPALSALADAYAVNWGGYASAVNDRRWAVSAQTTAQRAVTLDPHLAVAHKALGNAYNSSGHPRRAAESYRRALELDPTYSTGLNNLAVVSYKTGRLDEAIQLVSRALERDPSDLVLLSNLGTFSLLIGDVDRALELAERVLQADDDSPLGLWLMLRVQLALGRSAEAAAIGRRAAEAHPRRSRLLQLAAAAEQLDGRPDAALELLQRATSATQPGGVGAAALRLSQLLWETGDQEAAAQIHRIFEAWILDALENEDQWRGAYWSAAIHAIRGEAAESAEWMRKAMQAGYVDHWALRWDPIFSRVIDDARYRQLAGELAARLGEMRRAIQDPLLAIDGSTRDQDSGPAPG